MRTIGKKLLALAFSVAVGVAFAAFLEGCSRLVVPTERPRNPVKGQFISSFGEHDYLLFWKLQPNLVNAGGYVSTNSLGLRSGEIGPKAPNEVRVLSLGESTTLAPQVPYEASYSAVLERMLDETEDAPHRVINAGVSGYSSFQAYQYLVHRGLALQPDVVLLYFGYNDFLKTAFLADRAERDGFAVERGLDDWALYDLRRRPLARLVGWLSDHSNLYRWIARQRGAALRADDVVERSENPRVPDEHRRKLLRMYAELCEREGIRLYVIVPIYHEFAAHAPLLREMAAELGVPIVDLPALLRERMSPNPARDFFDAIHPRANVHRMIAEEVHRAMTRR